MRSPFPSRTHKEQAVRNRNIIRLPVYVVTCVAGLAAVLAPAIAVITAR